MLYCCYDPPRHADVTEADLDPEPDRREEDAAERLAGEFEAQRLRLRSVAYRMLGSISEADDAVQEAWLRLSRVEPAGLQNLAGWLTTVVARVCLNVLRTRAAHPEQQLSVHVPDPVVGGTEAGNPEHEALLADAVGLALLVVLDALSPAERLAFVLHDMFSVPYDDIASVAGCSVASARQLASRARRRVSLAPVPDVDLARQSQVVDAFFAASRHGDFAALVALLDPDVVLRADGGPNRPQAAGLVSGAGAVAEQVLTYGPFVTFVRPAVVNAAAGAVVAPRGRVVSVMGFVVRGSRVVAIDVLADPVRLRSINFAGVDLGDRATVELGTPPR